MAISRQQKEVVVAEIKDLIQQSKLTVLVNYSGLKVSQFQDLRALADSQQISFRVVKNNLFLKALKDLELDQGLDKEAFCGMILYAFSLQDEVAAPQTVKNFIKKQPSSLQFIGALTETGEWLDDQIVGQLANLASKPELINQVLSTLGSPLDNLQNSLNTLPKLMQTLQSTKQLN